MSEVSHFFRLSIDGENEEPENSFLEVSDLSTTMELENIQEGEENRFRHKLPTKPKYENLVLKRGLMHKHSAIFKWCMRTLEELNKESIKPKTLTLELIDRVEGTTVVAWQLAYALPVKWATTTADVDSEDEIWIESLTFSYSYVSQTR